MIPSSLKWLYFFWAALLFSYSPLQAGSVPEVPTTLAEIKVVNAEQVLAMMEQGTTLIIDSRKSSDFKHGTIPGAIHCMVASGNRSLDDAEVNQTIKDFKQCPEIMTAKPGQKLMVFCNGKTCWRSPKGALALHRMGFKQIHWFRLGMNQWKAKKYPME